MCNLNIYYFPYLGKDEVRQAAQRLSESVVIKIMEPYVGKRRSITTDNFFTSTPLARRLQEKNVTFRDSKQIPKGSSAAGKSFTAQQIFQQTLSNKVRQQSSRNINSLLVQTKEERLYSYHTSYIFYGRHNNKKKLKTLSFYNKTKCGVDIAE